MIYGYQSVIITDTAVRKIFVCNKIIGRKVMMVFNKQPLHLF